jgi:tRNA pseudouridine38-40 synthase
MARFKLYIEFDGTRYSGWQVQKECRTVQGALMSAADSVFGVKQSDIQGAGRTDSGVHAVCQIAHLEVKTMLSPEIIRMKLNDKLPYDINIMRAEKATPQFHARHDAVSRSYVYQIARNRTAFGKQYVWWIKDKLDAGKMNSALKIFLGMHNFSSFADDDGLEKSKKVMIESVELKECGDLILIRIRGSHFLWKQVRRMIGVIAEIGRGKINETELNLFLTKKSDKPAKYTAPPSGLFLEQVMYKGDEPYDGLEPWPKIGQNKIVCQ